MNPFAAIDWPNVLAFLIIEVVTVLCLAPLIIQRRNEDRAVAVFEERLLPLMPKPPSAEAIGQAVQAALPSTPLVDVGAAIREALAGLQPTPEQQARAQADLGAVITQAAQAAIGDAVKGRMSALSASGVDARATKALTENTLKARVGEKYGLKGLAALRILQSVDKDVYQLGLDAVSFAPDSLDGWLDDNAGRFTIGEAGAKRHVTVV